MSAPPSSFILLRPPCSQLPGYKKNITLLPMRIPAWIPVVIIALEKKFLFFLFQVQVNCTERLKLIGAKLGDMHTFQVGCFLAKLQTRSFRESRRFRVLRGSKNKINKLHSRHYDFLSSNVSLMACITNMTRLASPHL